MRRLVATALVTVSAMAGILAPAGAENPPGVALKLTQLAPFAMSAMAVRQNGAYADGGGRPEIWASGFRNPWRFSFDRVTGDLWIGEVGQARADEIDLALASDGGGRGENFGWNRFEGDHRRLSAPLIGDAPHHPPLTVLPHGQESGCTALIGGYVYRGASIPALDGVYLYGDFCDSKLYWLRQADGEITESGVLDLEIDDLTSFGQDADGELYLLSLAQGLFRIDPA